MDEGTIKKRASIGVMSLILRTGILKIISFIGSIILARLLIPADFGIYAIVSFIVTFFGTFTNAGLGASLIRKSTVTNKELTTAFTTQQILTGTVCIIIIVIAPLFNLIWKTSTTIEWLVRIMVISFFINSLGVVPTIQLERELKYNKLVVSDVLRSVSYTFTSVILAYSGYGVWSFILGAFVSSILGTISLFIISPWHISIGIDKKSLKEMLSFGVVFQAGVVVSLVYTSVTPVLVGVLAGATGLGYVVFADATIQFPLIFVYAYQRVTFPTFSYLKDNKETYRKAIEKSIRYASYFLYPLFFIILTTASFFIPIIFGNKWMPALPVIYISLVYLMIYPMIVPSNSMFFVAGKPGIVLSITTAMAIITWAAGIPLILYFGFIGLPLANLFNALIWKYQYDEMKKIIDFKIYRNMYPAFLSALGAGIIIYVITLFVNMNFIMLVLTGAFGLLIYLLFLYGFEGKKLIVEIKNIYLLLIKKETL
ncbi:MAG: oligosaccharide flippase family protein [Thermoplasmata archaeon]